MPYNCPIGLVPFSGVMACEDCPQYHSPSDSCCWYSPYPIHKPLLEILTQEERIIRLEAGVSKTKTQYIPIEPQAHMTRIKAVEEKMHTLQNALTRKQFHPTPPLKRKDII